MNPFELTVKPIEENFMDMKKMYPKAYNKTKTSPYTKTRIILLNGTEFESTWFMHQFARNCDNDEIKKELADLDKEKVLEIAKEKGNEAKRKAQELVDLAKEKGTPVLKKTAEEILEKVIKVSKETIKKLEAK